MHVIERGGIGAGALLCSMRRKYESASCHDGEGIEMPDCRTSNPCFTFPRNTQNASITFMDGTPDYLHHPSVNTVPSALYLKVYTPGRGRNMA